MWSNKNFWIIFKRCATINWESWLKWNCVQNSLLHFSWLIFSPIELICVISKCNKLKSCSCQYQWLCVMIKMTRTLRMMLAAIAVKILIYWVLEETILSQNDYPHLFLFSTAYGNHSQLLNLVQKNKRRR